jgi:hypothetical protein
MMLVNMMMMMIMKMMQNIHVTKHKHNEQVSDESSFLFVVLEIQ